MKIDIKKIISRVFIAAGLLLLLAGLIFELMNLPWRPMLEKIGINFSEDLADPAPINPKLLSTEVPVTVGEIPAELPELSQRFETKEEVPLVPIGVFKFPRLGISENIVEGSGQEMLYGIGHLKGSAMPGEVGNCVLPGHRNYVVMHPFMHLDMAENGDLVQVSYGDKTYIYEVFKKFSVVPEEMWVTAPQEGEQSMLTLITCSQGMTPTHRIIIWCRLVDEKPNKSAQAIK